MNQYCDGYEKMSIVVVVVNICNCSIYWRRRKKRQRNVYLSYIFKGKWRMWFCDWFGETGWLVGNFQILVNSNFFENYCNLIGIL